MIVPLCTDVQNTIKKRLQSHIYENLCQIRHAAWFLCRIFMENYVECNPSFEKNKKKKRKRRRTRRKRRRKRKRKKKKTRTRGKRREQARAGNKRPNKISDCIPSFLKFQGRCTITMFIHAQITIFRDFLYILKHGWRDTRTVRGTDTDGMASQKEMEGCIKTDVSVVDQYAITMFLGDFELFSVVLHNC